jgi:hypothetical protein
MAKRALDVLVLWQARQAVAGAAGRARLAIVWANI